MDFLTVTTVMLLIWFASLKIIEVKGQSLTTNFCVKVNNLFLEAVTVNFSLNSFSKSSDCIWYTSRLLDELEISEESTLHIVKNVQVTFCVTVIYACIGSFFLVIPFCTEGAHKIDAEIYGKPLADILKLMVEVICILDLQLLGY